MIKVGLTGGIGSGKTHIAGLFLKLNIPVYNSDNRGKYLMSNDEAVKKQLIDAFGPETFCKGELNRNFLAKQVFNDSSKLTTINQIVHPAVKIDYENWLHTNSNKPYTIKEAAILIESGAYKDCDKLIVVTAPLDVRIKRIEKRDNMTPDEINSRIAKQISDEERLKYANYVVNNDGIMLVDKQIIEIHKQLLKLCN